MAGEGVARARALILSALLVVAGYGCTQHYVVRLNSKPNDPLARAAAALDRLKWYTEAYGGAAMSSPLLVEPDDSFKFDLTQVNADTFFADAKDEISGKSASDVESASVFGLNASAALDVTAMQQYQAAMQAYRGNQATIARKRAIIDRAAYAQYASAIQAANKIADPAARQAAVSAAATQLASSLSGPNVDDSNPLPTPPSPPTLPTVDGISNSAASVLSPLAAPQALYAAGTPPVVGDTRSALLSAAGDVTTRAMLALLGNPSKVEKFKGKRVLFGISMISVSPGWKTQTGYSADLEGHLRYVWTWARPAVRDAFLAEKSTDSPIEQEALQRLQSCVADSAWKPRPASEPLHAIMSELDGPYADEAFAPYVLRGNSDIDPVVEAVSPMGDLQALDLQSAVRAVKQRALQMAFLLTMAGYGADASAFEHFAAQQQQDIETRVSRVVVSAYSSVDGAFGFRMYPKLEATQGGKSSNGILDVPSFPTLILIGMDDQSIRPRVAVTKSGCFVVEPQLGMYTATRWAPLTEQCAQKRWHPVLGPTDSPCDEERTEQEWVALVSEVDHDIRDAEVSADQVRGTADSSAVIAALESEQAARTRATEAHGKAIIANRQAETDAGLVKQAVDDFAAARAGKLATMGVADAKRRLAADARDLERARKSAKIATDRELEADAALDSARQHADKAIALFDGARWNANQEATVADELHHRETLLLNVLNGETQNLVLPQEILISTPPPASKPSVDAVAPDHVDLVLDAAGKPIVQNVTMFIAGSHLDQVDLSKIAGVGTFAVPPTAKLVDKVIQLSFSVDHPGGIVFTLPVKGGLGFVETKPFLVNAATNVLTVTHGKDTVTFTPGTPPGVVKSEIEKDKRYYPQRADVKVDVKAEDRK